MKNRLFISLLTLITPLFVMAQHPNVMISNSNTPNEPAIVINPKNTDVLMAGANLNNYYYSTDGGYNWTAGQLSSNEHGVWGDPCLLVDTAQNFYFFHLANPQNGNWIDRIVCQKTSGPGQPWNDGSAMGLNGSKAQDKEWGVVDPRNNNIYVSWTQFDDYGSAQTSDSSLILFSRSLDGGLSWSDPTRLSQKGGDCIDDDNTVEGAVPAIGPEGQIYIAWAGPLGIQFDRSLDEGLSWLNKDIFAAEMPEGWAYDIPGINRCNGLPVTCCDISEGPHRGTIYINWTDQRHGTDDTDVWLTKSTDGGDTWSPAIRVNDDEAGHQQFFTWMTIDQTNGYLYFVFYDRRAYDDTNTDVYMAVSRDGGETFINEKISESPFVPNPYVFFGDYTNITAHNNVIRPIWARADGSSLSLYTAIINPDIVGTQSPQLQPFTIEQNYPNPFNQNTSFAFKLHAPATINLSIYDMLGHNIATVVNNEWLPAGKHVRDFNAEAHNLAPGLYYFNLDNGQETVKRRMLFIQ